MATYKITYSRPATRAGLVGPDTVTGVETYESRSGFLDFYDDALSDGSPAGRKITSIKADHVVEVRRTE